MQCPKSLAEGALHGSQGAENMVGEVVLCEVIPDRLGGIQLGAAGRECDQTHLGWHLQVVRDVPSRAIEEQQAEVALEASRHLLQVRAHDLGVMSAADQATHRPVERIDGHESVQELAYDLATHARAERSRCPAGTQIVDAAEPAFVLEQYADPTPTRRGGDQAADTAGKPLLNAAWTSSSASGCRGRGATFRQP